MDRRVKELFDRRVPLPGDAAGEVVAFLKGAEAYGEAFGNIRRGKRFAIANLSLRVSWAGSVRIGPNVIGEAKGAVHVDEITPDNAEEDWEVAITILGQHKDDAKDPASQALLTDVERRVRGLVREQCLPIIGTRVRAVLAELNGLAQGATEEEVRTDLGEEDERVARQERAEERREQHMREARERAIPARYRDTLAALRDPEFAGDEVALDHLGLTDAEFGPLFEALKGHAGVREVSLRGNAFTNVSLQVLVAGVAAGALPNLRRLALAGNGFSDMAATMLAGLKIIRKDLEVQV